MIYIRVSQVAIDIGEIFLYSSRVGPAAKVLRRAESDVGCWLD